jgi:hypothetical protein
MAQPAKRSNLIGPEELSHFSHNSRTLLRSVKPYSLFALSYDKRLMFSRGLDGSPIRLTEVKPKLYASPSRIVLTSPLRALIDLR